MIETDGPAQTEFFWPGNDQLDVDRLRHTPKSERKIALILAGNIDADIAASAVTALRVLATDGYRVSDIPINGDALMDGLLDDPIAAEETFPRSDYGMFFASLPRAAQDRVNERWGAPERDPSFRESRLDCGAFAVRAIRCGNVIVARPPSRGDATDPAPDLPPTHGYLAFYAWLTDGIRAHAILHLGKHVPLEALLSKVLAR